MNIKGEHCCDLDLTVPNVEILFGNFIENLQQHVPDLKFFREIIQS